MPKNYHIWTHFTKTDRKPARNPLRKPSRKPTRNPARVFTKGFTAENVKIFYDKLTSSGMAVPVLELDRRQWGTCNAKHMIGGVPATRKLMHGPLFHWK